jgi:hypothetical protein
MLPRLQQMTGGTATTTAIDISRTSIELAKPLEIKDNKKDRVGNEYSLHAKNRGKSQQILEMDVKSIQNEHYLSLHCFWS